MKKSPIRSAEWLLTLPSFCWLFILFMIPTVAILAISLRPADPFGGIGSGWTLETLRRLANPSYPLILWRTLCVSLLTTLICLLFATPCAYFMARSSLRWRQILLLLVIIPFWTSFLVRIFAWKVLLYPEGILSQMLVFLGLAKDGTLLLYNTPTVLLVMVYTFLPFAILPLYAAAEKFDFHLLESCTGPGGALPSQAFLHVFLPGIKRGILTATLVVFIPALGSYVIPDLVGGPGSELLGNKIAQRVFVDRNLPQAAALSGILILGMLLPLVAVIALQRKQDQIMDPAGEAP